MSNLRRVVPKAGSWQGTDLKTSAKQSLSAHFRQQPAGKLSALRLAFEHRSRVLPPLGRWQRRKPKGPGNIPGHPGDHRQSRHPAQCPAHRLPGFRQPLRPRSPGPTERVPLQDRRDPLAAAGEHARRRRGARTLALRTVTLPCSPICERNRPPCVRAVPQDCLSAEPRHP